MTVTSSIKSSLGDYATAQQWEDAIPTDATEEYHGNIDEAFNAGGVNINVSNSDASAPTHRLRGGVGFRWTEAVATGTTHGGAEDSYARISNSINTGIIISTDRIHVSHLEVRGFGATTRDGVQTTQSGSVGIVLDHLLIRDCGDEGVYCQRGGVLVYDCVIYGCDVGIWTANSTSDLTAINNTVYGCVFGCQRTGGTFISKNNACLGNSTGDFQLDSGSWGTGTDWNLSSDTTAPGTNTYQSVTASGFFVSLTGGAEDFHMASANDGNYEGSDESGTFTVDADDDTRVDWDVGAYEIIAAGGGAFSASAAGSGSVAASVTGTGALAGSMAGTSSPSATFTGTGAVAGTLDGAGTLNGALTGSGAVVASSAGTGGLAAVLGGIGALAASAAGTGSLTAVVFSFGPFDATAAGSATLSAVLDGFYQVAGSLDGSATVVATLSGTGAVAASAAGIGSVACVLIGYAPFSAASAGVATVSVAMLGLGVFDASADGSSSLAATLEASGAVAASMPGAATVTATFGSTAPFAASAAGSSTMTAVIENVVLVHVQASLIEGYRWVIKENPPMRSVLEAYTFRVKERKS